MYSEPERDCDICGERSNVHVLTVICPKDHKKTVLLVCSKCCDDMFNRFRSHKKKEVVNGTKKLFDLKD